VIVLIRNRLSILLAERNLKITKVSKDTGIARSTLTTIAQNDVKMIQLETINALCIYLGVNPGDFFEFIPYDIECSIYTNYFDIEYEHSDYEVINAYPSTFDFDLFVSIKGKQNSVEASFTGVIDNVKQSDETNHNFCNIQLEFDQNENKEAFQKFLTDLSPGFSGDVEQKINEVINNELSTQTNKYIESHDISDEVIEILNNKTITFIESNSLPNYGLPF
jgi:DNA-binding Xre family transcriptional regulator